MRKALGLWEKRAGWDADNLSKLLYYILNALPAQKRAAVFEGLNTEAENYRYNDEEDYKEQVVESFGSMTDYVAEGINSGAEKAFYFLAFREQLQAVSKEYSAIFSEKKVMLSWNPQMTIFHKYGIIAK